METNYLFKWVSMINHQKMMMDELSKILQRQYDIGINEFYVLFVLSQSPERQMRLSDLIQQISLSQSAMSRLIGRLEAKNPTIIMRKNNNHDKRSMLIQLTNHGLKVTQQAIEEVNYFLVNRVGELNFSKDDLQA
ncbi:MarR family winged helix-turn-helix transcriptional regulator [Enterococcus columbae]|uniref:HTH marR-type domain-containing protein n=1 Tax=Enterococcus columbae DSM 7374 = ATCC 51263 TaxID=1121865 RepID=S0KZ05_9ENTE|nr:MarR family transcriptional regulator [Enterococcus columbae]EOT44511.1 hypothetical protein OMW_00567 [Enterococcus columbae DSM 7374 = ATCC 51263]EOW84669.1 hypothetical protein I568_01165 [Enterococcus columbae DSM 7374 = ATCC 51263]